VGVSASRFGHAASPIAVREAAIPAVTMTRPPIALVRRPSPRLAEGIVTHVERRPVEHQLALRQWDDYVETLRSTGWQTIEVPPAQDCPDSVFVEDTMVVYRNVAVMARPGAEARTPEVSAAEKTVEGLGYSVNRIRPPGTLEGGDVLKIGDTVYVGRGGRTNAAGVSQLREILTPVGASVVVVPVNRVLHLKSAVTALPDGTVIGFRPLVDNPDMFPHFLGVPEESGGHVVLLGDGQLLIAADCPTTTALLAGLGYHPVIVDISEFQKLEGCVTCLSVRLRSTPA
jgi:dimethylargininase